MSELGLHDIVRILMYPEDSINAYARVVDIHPDGEIIYVSNLNMPFQGTLTYRAFTLKEVLK